MRAGKGFRTAAIEAGTGNLMLNRISVDSLVPLGSMIDSADCVLP